MTQLRLVGLPALVVFQSECSPTWRDLRPSIEQIAKKYPSKVEIRLLDSTDCAQLASEMHVWIVPTILFVKGGREVRRTEGSLPFERMEAMVVQLFVPVSLYIDS